FPHFSSEKLSAKYGHNVTLSYMYYLKQGRPSIAVNVFIVDQLRLHRKISRKMKKQACNFAHGLALKRFANQSITCACISFIEMLGVDSGNVRIHVAAANKILNYLNSSVSHSTGKEQLHEEQVELTSYEDSNDVFCTLLSCHRSQDPPRALLTACHTLRNPLFAIFATCYEPSSVLACFCTWLITSLGSCISANLKSKLCSALQQNVWPVQQVESLLKEIVSTGYITTLARGFSIFLPVMSACDFKLLAQLAECLEGTGVLADWVALCHDKGCTEYQAELKHCVDQLVENGRYQQGLDFVSLVGLPKDSVMIAQDLQLLWTCMSLAEGEITPYQMSAEHRMLLSEPAILEKLVEHLQHGRKLGSRLVCCFRVAMNLDMPYQEILKLEDPLRLLHTSLANDCCNKFVVASDLMLAAQMNSEEVSRFLCQEIVAAVSNHVQVVEILIRAHDCYTTALNMEGIVAVLHRAHILTNNLLQRQDWALMVRLLTGIGRYTEMNYIFQMLKDNEQFEFLLGKGLDKVPNLKLAVLDFLKQHCPEDRELFRLVSLHFSLFSEVADLWESEGCARVHTLLAVMGQQTATAPVLLTNTEDTKLCLNTAMVNFMHASEYFLQTNKLTRAMTAAHHAELVALQLSLINSLPLGQGADCLLELDSAQVAYMVTHKLSFPQACIMTRAYSHPVDWGATLYQHCIVQGDAAYLTDFMFNMPLTSALVEDVARSFFMLYFSIRFQLEANVTQEMAQQMKKFVLGISDVEIKYRVASQLGFRDVIESLLTGPALPYLKDTVWRSGFNKHRNYLQ
ncbi:hypothetical protein L798_02233, partial [Zootermopsis nevadensis]